MSDGTGNSAASLLKTNVWRLYQALDLSSDDQVAFYDDGVGTSTLKPCAAIGGALGFGLKRNVKQLYKNLCQTYEPGDSIYAFGFSRGAFTIRVLVGLISSQGIIDGRKIDTQELRRKVEEAYKADRKAYRTGWWKIVEFFQKMRAILVLFPWIWETLETQVCTGYLCPIGSVVVVVTKFLPSWVEEWATAFRMHPGKFAGLAVLLTALMLFGSWLEKRIEARSAEAWSKFAGFNPPTVRSFGVLSWIARRIRTSKWAVASYRWFARDFLPFVCFIGILAGVVIAANKIAFESWEALGGTCENSDETKLKDTSKATNDVEKEFNTGDQCFATGMRLVEGRTYVIEFRVTKPWVDGAKATTPAGFSSADGGWTFRLAAPLLRSWTAQWFEPVARIGVYGRDRYNLSPRLETVPADQKSRAGGTATVSQVYTSKQFIARNTGELFLFVNDAFLALPGAGSWFYDGAFDDGVLCTADDKMCVNNKGSAKVVVRASAAASH